MLSDERQNGLAFSRTLQLTIRATASLQFDGDGTSVSQYCLTGGGRGHGYLARSKPHLPSIRHHQACASSDKP